MNVSSLESLLEILVCPVTHQPLRLATEDETRTFNQHIEKGLLRTSDGNTVHKSIEAAFIRHDNILFYPVRAGLPTMIAEEAVIIRPETLQEYSCTDRTSPLSQP